MEVNFKANLLSRTNVRKYSPNLKRFAPQQVSFLEINPRCKKDIKSLKRIAKIWGKGSLFADNIYQYAKSDLKRRTFILTEQNEGFDVVDATKILGIGQLTKEDTDKYCIEYLETKPDYQQKNKSREYKRIGNRFLHSLKKEFYDKILRVNFLFDENVIKFYMNNGFSFLNNIFGDLVWKAQNRK